MTKLTVPAGKLEDLGSGVVKVTVDAAGSAFSPPGSVDGLYAWFAADNLAGLSDGDHVHEWPNAVPGVGFSLESTGDPTYKTNILNSLPVVRLAGSDYFQYTLTAMAAQGGSFVVVFKLSAITNAYSGIVGYGIGDAGGYFIKSNGKSADYYSGTGADGTGAASFDTTNWNYVTVIHALAAGIMRRNGATDLVSINWPAGNGAQWLGYIGSHANPGRVMSGDIAELLVYSRPLSAADITAIESYITTKYAL